MLHGAVQCCCISTSSQKQTEWKKVEEYIIPHDARYELPASIRVMSVICDAQKFSFPYGMRGVCWLLLKHRVFGQNRKFLVRIYVCLLCKRFRTKCISRHAMHTKQTQKQIAWKGWNMRLCGGLSTIFSVPLLLFECQNFLLHFCFGLWKGPLLIVLRLWLFSCRYFRLPSKNFLPRNN